jgi:hypothetical protein
VTLELCWNRLCLHMLHHDCCVNVAFLTRFQTAPTRQQPAQCSRQNSWLGEYNIRVGTPRNNNPRHKWSNRLQSLFLCYFYLEWRILDSVSFCVCVVNNARKQYKKPIVTYRSLFELSASKEPCRWWSLCHSIDALGRSVRDYTPQCRLFPIVHRWDDVIRVTCRIWKWSSWGAQYDHLRRFTHWNVWPELHTHVY